MHSSFVGNVPAARTAESRRGGWLSRLRSGSDDRVELQGQVQAIGRSQAVAQFSLDGHLLAGNDNFLKVIGYSLEEVLGQHHSMFVDAAHRNSAEYRAFWAKLARGEYDAGQYKRYGKNGREIWMQASYNPILDARGRPVKIIKYATDITEQRLRNADFEGQLNAIAKSQAVIEFALDGRILQANELFLNALGYSLDEIRGQHHSMFVDADYRGSPDYRAFWDKLARGEYDAGQYQRVGKGGREIWIQASYNPIFDLNGKPFKVVKYASDVTESVRQARTLQQAVEQTRAAVEGACAGDLTHRIPLEGKSGAIAELCGGVNMLIDNMAAVVGQIKQTTETISTAASEIATGNTDLSSRTEQQAASLEETASSMEELTSTVKQNAENARQANQLAIGAVDVATRGGLVVGDVVKTMAAIDESSRKVVDIISVIDSIAFQTNILALNAAVEAARAGEQGRGFAVVASEVRSLAQRSAGAAREIKGLIGDSTEKVAAGSRLVEQAGSTMGEIVTSIKRVTDIMAEITAASQEQSQGIEQVNRTITHLDEVTQQNAALVEEASAAARSLEEQTVSLTSSVSHFRVDSSSASAPIARAVASVPTPIRVAPKLVARSPRPVAAKAGGERPQRRANGAADEQWQEF